MERNHLFFTVRKLRAASISSPPAESPNKTFLGEQKSIHPADQGDFALWRDSWLLQELPQCRDFFGFFSKKKQTTHMFVLNGERCWLFRFTHSRIRATRANDADNLKFIFNEREITADNEIWKIKREWLRSRAPTAWYVRCLILVAMGFSSFLSTAAGECCFFYFVFIFLTFYFWIQRCDGYDASALRPCDILTIAGPFKGKVKRSQHTKCK